MVEKLNGLGVQGKVISVLCVGDREGAPVSKAQHCIAALRPQSPQRDGQREKAATKNWAVLQFDRKDLNERRKTGV